MKFDKSCTVGGKLTFEQYLKKKVINIPFSVRFITLLIHTSGKKSKKVKLYL